MPGPAAFPWDAVMAAGLGRLALTPDAFWRTTPRELAAALGLGRTGGGGVAPGRTTLADLMRRFPDSP